MVSKDRPKRPRPPRPRPRPPKKSSAVSGGGIISCPTSPQPPPPGPDPADMYVPEKEDGKPTETDTVHMKNYWPDPLFLYINAPISSFPETTENFNNTFKGSFKKLEPEEQRDLIEDIFESGKTNEELDEWLSEQCPDLVIEVGRDRYIEGE